MSSLLIPEDSSAPPTATLRRSVAVVDMVAYSSIARILEQNTSAASVAELNRQIQAFMTGALAQLPPGCPCSVVARTGDGIILLFDHAIDAHAFGYHVHLLAKQHNDQRSETTAKRWFRVGIATGEVTSTDTAHSPAEYAGTTIANAVRLEAAAHAGEIVLDADSFAGLPAETRILYGPGKTIHGKRDETFRVHRFQVTPRIKNPAGFSPRFLTRRVFFSGAASVLGGAAIAAWLKPELLDPILHPLPLKRFVALIGWPAPTDARLEPTLAAVVNAIGDELIRAEAFDRNLLILPYSATHTPTSVAELNDIRESLGANLILAASGSPFQDQLHLNLRVLAPPSHSLRETVVSVPIAEQLTLPEKAVHAATRLLDISAFHPDQKRSTPGTFSAEAFTAFQTGERLLRQDNDAGLDKAIDQYKQAIDLDPKYADAHARLAMAYRRLAAIHPTPGALDLATENARTALLYDPASIHAHLALAGVEEQKGNLPGALDEIKKALAVDPANPGTLTWQAQFYDRLNRWPEAEQALARVIQQRPNEWHGHNALGAAYNNQGKYELALREFNAAALASPHSSLPLNNIAALSLQLGRIPEAMESCRRSLQIAPSAIAASNMAAILRVQSNPTAAVPFARQATVLDPDDSLNWLELGDCYSMLPGKSKEALAAYQQALHSQQAELQTDPADGPGLMLLALLQAKCNPLADVSPIIQKADAAPAADIDSQLCKARTLELTHHRPEAITTLRQCLTRGATRFQVETTPDLQDLIKDPAYKAITIKAAPLATQPGGL